VVVFSLAEVYATAERLRRRRGGAAVVFGALSPRARNAQVGLYQAGEVDHLVATDAIGMGLNLDIDHVVFTGLAKFDGQGQRALSHAEVAQIAGRAGRHTRDGSFGPSTDLGPFDAALVAAIESHRFDSLKRFFWRNTDLVFSSPQALLASLERKPPIPELSRVADADDHRALQALLADAELAGLVRSPEQVRLLWDVCQVPDFRNVMTDAHTWLLGRVFRHLSGPGQVLPEDWVAAQIGALDRTDGDSDTLLARIAGIRTWTYVSYRQGWLADPIHWQERARGAEDRLSDALHERLTEQFVDRRGVLIAREEPGALVTTVTEAGEVQVQGLRAGRLEGFRFVPDADVADGARGLLAAANRALREEADALVEVCVSAADAAFGLRADGRLTWRGAEVARLQGGDDVLAPRVEALPSELLDPPRRERVRRRLADWLAIHLRRELAPLFALREAAEAGPNLRALAFVLTGTLGCTPRRAVAQALAALSLGERRRLSELGVRIGRLAVWLPAVQRPQTLAVRARLWAARHGSGEGPLPDGRASLPLAPEAEPGLLASCGYLPVGPRAVRPDRLERVAAEAYERSKAGRLTADAALAAVLECTPEDLRGVLEGIGYQAVPDGRFRWRKAGLRRPGKEAPRTGPPAPRPQPRPRQPGPRRRPGSGPGREG
jgi:ATP-dependent RNA helicase SUPV3L1/SUV3